MALNVTPNANVTFDGSSSDLAQQFYALYKAGKESVKLGVMPKREIVSRLDALNLSFHELPGLLQRAVVWDTGYVFNTYGDLVKVNTKIGHGMSEIAITREKFDAQGCKTQNCSTPEGARWQKNGECNGNQMASVALCSIDELGDDQDCGLSMWSTGGDPKRVPEMIAYRHKWLDNGVTYNVYAIHTRTMADSPVYGTCDRRKDGKVGTGSLVIPCVPKKQLDPMKLTNFGPPVHSDLVNAWLKEFKESLPVPTSKPPQQLDPPSTVKRTVSPQSGVDQPTDYKKLLVIVSIVGGAIVLVLLIAIFLLRKRRRGDDDTQYRASDAKHYNDKFGPNAHS
ncbi:hypothetical protein P43SY_001026 [Pythium insidiosum]|uniref:TKL protein kinase n=1 Tax=Pythium insidiosum TaxID=114742 RepID=A0AAD5LA19_PYTIN|nr:hypothetical protein P43SY_001026 [Pythium insidiosum]